MGFVPEYVSVWVVANGGRWVALEAGLAREGVVGAESALLLAPGVTIGLGHTKRCKTHAMKFRQTEGRWKVRPKACSSPVRGCTSKTSHKTGVRAVEATTWGRHIWVSLFLTIKVVSRMEQGFFSRFACLFAHLGCIICVHLAASASLHVTQTQSR